MVFVGDEQVVTTYVYVVRSYSTAYISEISSDFWYGAGEGHRSRGFSFGPRFSPSGRKS